MQLKKSDDEKSFYSIQQYENWKEKGNDSSGWEIRYYKGLGSHSPEEGRDYFQNMEKHEKYFIWEDGDDQAIDVAFGRDALPRKEWINRIVEYGDHERYLNAKTTSYASFINNELVFYARADIQRSIPSLVDGLTKVRRKILFGLLEDTDPRSKCIWNLVGTVAERTTYNHNSGSMSEAMIKMAQHYAGSNNINLLVPLGTLDSNESRGKGNCSTDRYVHVKLNSITRCLFLEADDKFLNYLNDEHGKSVEPYCFQPIIPMILVNGCIGIAVGWSSHIPNYKPSHIIHNIKNWLMDKPFFDMMPSYKGFLGSIIEDPNKKGSLLVKGKVKIINKTTFSIEEIPFTKSKKDYKEFLTSITKGPRGKTRQIESFEEEENGFKIHLIKPIESKKTKKPKNLLDMESLIKEFDLQSAISINNMHLLDENMNIKKYDTVNAILEEFLAYRLVCYEKKKNYMVDQLKRDMKTLEHKIMFIELWRGSPAIEKEELLSIFKKKSFEKNPEEQIVDDYNYLLSMPINTFYDDDSLQKMEEERQTKEMSLKKLQKTTPKEMWLEDLMNLESHFEANKDG